ncbi:hypothetical protein ACD578_30395 (plasmid) [Microvirga sp. RSM25]
MLDPQDYVTTWNMGAEHITGWQKDEILGAAGTSGSISAHSASLKSLA